jgi:hypothetical protein
VRSPWQGKPVTRFVWLVEVRVLGVDWEPWLLLTDWPVTDAQCAVRIFIMYRQRALCGGQFQISQNLSGLEEVQLLAKLGGWKPHKDRTPGKITLLRGLSRLLEMLATQAILSSYATQHQGLPPNITALSHGWQPPGDL